MALVYHGLNKVANNVQDPYGTDAGDLPLDNFANQLREDFEAYETHWTDKSGLHEDFHLKMGRIAHIHDYD